MKVLYTIQNINETKKRELEYEKKLADIAEDARRSSLSKTDFLRRMSHDIRTPINSIRGMIEIANHYSYDPDKLRDCQQKVWEASGYLLSLVNSVLDMNKLESGAVLRTILLIFVSCLTRLIRWRRFRLLNMVWNIRWISTSGGSFTDI